MAASRKLFSVVVISMISAVLVFGGVAVLLLIGISRGASTSGGHYDVFYVFPAFFFVGSALYSGSALLINKYSLPISLIVVAAFSMSLAFYVFQEKGAIGDKIAISAFVIAVASISIVIITEISTKAAYRLGYPFQGEHARIIRFTKKGLRNTYMGGGED